MIKVLIDTNIVLDMVLEREPFVEEAMELFEWIESGRVQGYIAATTVTNIFYIVRKAQGREVALSAVRRILMGLALCQVDRPVIAQAIDSNLKDFEDGVQFACARSNQLDAIVTRDRNDFAGVALPIWSIADLMAQLS